MPKILIVDDEPDILLMLRINLEAEGYETALAADGETALRRIDDECPDALLLDVMMPVMDGWSVLESLSTRPESPRVIVLPAQTASRDIRRALDLGAAEYLTKPFEPESLLATIERVLVASEDELDVGRAATIARLDGQR
jgi:DNA-binding response OmpR family regulator